VSLVVDIHSHLYPDWFVDFFRGRTKVPRVVADREGERLLLFTTQGGEESGPMLTESYTTVAAKLNFMRMHGIDCSVVSLGNPWLEVFEPDESLDLAHHANARMAALAEETAGRIIGMGVLPRSEPTDIARVVEQVAHTPGLKGMISSTTIGGLHLDDTRLDPVWEALAATRSPLMIHPMIAEVPEELSGYGIAMSAGIGFPFKTTIALARLLLGGVLKRHAGLRLVAAHGGGALPFLIGRLEGTLTSESRSRSTPRQSAGHLLLDAALYDAGAVHLAANLVGADQLMFGTDHPFPNADVTRIRGAIASGLSGAEASATMGEAAAAWYQLPVETQ